MATCPHPAFYTTYIDGVKYMVCTQCGAMWEV
jgi:hypothetical protein